MSAGWLDIAVQRYVYTRMVSSKARACACLGLGVVVTGKVADPEGSAPGSQQVLRTIPESSVIIVRKLWATVSSSSRFVATLVRAASDRFAGATGSRSF